MMQSIARTIEILDILAECSPETVAEISDARILR